MRSSLDTLNSARIMGEKEEGSREEWNIEGGKEGDEVVKGH